MRIRANADAYPAGSLARAFLHDAANVVEAIALQISDDVRRLVIAARVVAFENQGRDAIKELDIASEAFSECVPWDDEPPLHG